MFKKICASVVAASFLAAPFAASAHERQLFTIGGIDYLFVIGSLGEPIVVDDKTGLDLRVKIADKKDPTNTSALGAIPVEGLESKLKLELIAGDKKKIVDISPAYKDPGAYNNTFFPTVKTSLTYRLFGTIADTPVDLSFTCAPEGSKATEDKSTVELTAGVTRIYKNGQFGCPRGKEELGFPEESVSVVGMHENLHGEMGKMTEDMMNDSQKGKAGAALALGLLGSILGGAALLRSRVVKSS